MNGAGGVEATERFARTADDYERHRPGYPLELVAWIAETCSTPKGGRVIDLGAGTGIATRLIAGCGYDVVGVEPNEEMRVRAERVGGARYVDGLAEATGLPDSSADLVVSAQAFHWFDLEKAMREIARILVKESGSKSGGAACAFWNVRAQTALLREYDAVLKRFVTKYDDRPRAEKTIEALGRTRGVQLLDVSELANVQRLDKEGLLGRAHSSSYVAHEVKDTGALDRALGQLFDKHARGGAVDFAYRTLALAWTLDARAFR